MVKPSRLKSLPWTRREIAVWVSALIAVITLGVLVITNVLGSWALIPASMIGSAVGLLRYRRERASRRLG
jgi:hypothetical protein